MDRDTDIEFFHQIVKAIERVWCGGCGNILDAGLFGKLEDLAIGLRKFVSFETT